MRTYRIILYHFLYWLLYESLCLFFLYISHGERADFLNDDRLIDLGLLTLTAVLSFYGSYYFLFSRYLANKRLKTFIITGLFLSLFSAAISTAIVSVIFYSAVSFFPGTVITLTLLAGFFVCAVINAIAATALRGVLHWWEDIRVKEALEKKNLATELEALKSQLQPHFLFNTINNIDVLIGIEPAKASQYLQHLSRMLRFILYRGKLISIPLEEEIQFIRDYIALQQIRKINPGWISLQTENSNKELFIAPLLFLPFIENACKYADTSNGGETVHINIILQGTRLVFTCKNNFIAQEQTDKGSGGLGLILSRQRMELSYPNRHHLEITATADTFTIHCTIDL
jgi:two-component system LytT family sensor kinase